MKDYSILIGGAAGEGSKKAGLMIAKLFLRYGYRIYIYEDYQSLIKGGHNFSLVRACQKEVFGSREDLDFLLPLNQDSLEKHQFKVNQNGLIVDFDADSAVKEAQGLPIMRNTALVAAFAKTVGFDWLTVKKVFEEELLIETKLNLKVAQKAYDKAQKKVQIEKSSFFKESLLSGNEALSLGALRRGLEAYVAYPMTPTTGVLNYLASVALGNQLIVFQPENEIGAVNTALGLSFSGKRTMTGTSGGGFCLMNEGVSLSAQAEIPLVVIEGQRMGPSTGVPTYGGQSDLLHVLASGHGDFTRIVLAPGDAQEAFFLSGLALDLAWKYQMPAIIITDKDLLESSFSFSEKKVKFPLIETCLWKNQGEYSRYQKTSNGVSPLAFPGNKKAVVKATSYEHDEKGIAVEDAEKIKEMQDKRKLKYASLQKEIDSMKTVNVYGQGSQALIVWGSTKNPAVEAGQKLGFKVIQPLIFQPFPEKEIKKALKNVSLLISVESNSSGQMSQVLRSNGIKVDREILKYDGRCFTAQEIYEKVRS
jgi:2-oxoglutarate/2-oxoacid ferredoxin oxidoreductase subunit alpha